MLNSVLATLGAGSLTLLQELQQVFLYFYTHAWVGLFFVLQVLGLLVTKARADSINKLWGLHIARCRPVSGVARAPLCRPSMNLFHYWF